MAYDYRANIGMGRPGVGAYQAGQQIGGGFRRATGESLGAYRQDQAVEKQDQNKAKVVSLVRKYNDQNDADFGGLEPSQKALKLSRLLYPLDPTMSSRYEKLAQELESRGAKFQQQKELKEIGQEQKAKRGDVTGIRARMNAVENSIRYMVSQGGFNYEDEEVQKKVKELEALKSQLTGEDAPTLRGAYQSLYVEPEAKAEATGAQPQPAPIDVDGIKTEIWSAVEPSIEYDEAGSIKNRLAVERTIRAEVRKRGLTPDVERDLLSDIERAEKYAVAQRGRLLERSGKVQSMGIQKRGEQATQTRDKIAQDEKYQPSWEAVSALKAKPNDITAKRMALNVKLRKETGAAIGANEFTDMMSFVLPQDTYRKFVSETTGLGSILSGMVSNDARYAYMKRVAEKYLNDVDVGKLSKYIDDSISKQYYRRSEKAESGPQAGSVDDLFE
jgi:hypothetical protein